MAKKILKVFPFTRGESYVVSCYRDRRFYPHWCETDNGKRSVIMLYHKGKGTGRESLGVAENLMRRYIASENTKNNEWELIYTE